MAINPDASAMELCSLRLADITQGIENVTLVSQQKYFILNESTDKDGRGIWQLREGKLPGTGSKYPTSPFLIQLYSSFLVFYSSFSLLPKPFASPLKDYFDSFGTNFHGVLRVSKSFPVSFHHARCLI